ncbi:MAG: thioesterase domain-containing protein, partial [Phormidesmis sp.]
PKAEGVAARSPLENKLVEIWENVLDVQPVGITDNFFELGGHSLLAMRLFSDIEITFQRSLPVTTIFAEPTIQQLASVLAAELSPGRQQAAKQLAAVDSIVPLRAGSSNCPPLFLVHDADGTTSPYIHLAAQLPGDRAIYGIEPLSGPNLPMAHSRIPDMAAYYIQQMRQAQPHGPYLLGGLCAGGVIAFEMALQLEALGETVALTVLLEAPDVAATERNTLAERRLQSLRETLPANKAKRLKRLVEKATNVIRYEIQNRVAQAKTTVKIKAFRYWQDRQAKGWTLPDSLQGLEARSLYLFAEKSYAPSALLRSQVVLIKAVGPGKNSADRPYHEVYEDALFGWRDRTHHPIASHQVPGGHFTMLSQENVSAVVEAIAPLIPSS